MDRNRLAAALAYEEERRRRMMEFVPTTDNLPPVQPTRRSLRTDLENLSSGIGQGVVNQLEGVKALVTDPVGTAKAAYEGVKGIVRDPSVLADALRYTAQKATSGPLGAGEVIGEMVSPMRGKPPVMQEIDVYHGSPHRFEEFDASKIGTGEGAQAYGHGIYLAENPSVAGIYKNSNRALDAQSLQNVPSLTPAEHSRLGELTMRERTNQGLTPAEIAELRQLESKQDQLVQQVNAIRQQAGSLYKADLPDEMVDRMLDYDLPIDQQSPYVLAALDRAGINTQSTALAGPMAQGQEKHLAKFGIPGIKYLDEGSRGQGGGTRNFVVFPGEEKKVKILERNGEKLAAALGTIKPKATVIEARATRAGRNLPDLEAELAAKNLTIQPNDKGGFDVYGRKVGFDPAIPQKLTTVKEGGRAAAIQAAKNIGRKTDAELQAAKTRNPFTAYAEFGNLDDYIADRPDLLEKLTRKKLVNVEPEIESVQPSFKNKNYRVRFKTGEEFSVENIKPETLDELKATVRKDLYSEQIPDQLQGKTVKDLISTLAWEERSEKYIKDVLSGKKRLRLED